MDSFTKAIAAVEKKCSALLNVRTYKVGALPKAMPAKGVYLFSQNQKYLYVGRTNNCASVFSTIPAINHNQATFAFLLARHKTGKMKASYKRRTPATIF